MKKRILFVLLLFPALLSAQEPYVIRGKVGHLSPPAKVFLVYARGDQRITDTAGIKDGVFSFAGQTADITQATLIMDASGTGLENLGKETPPDLTALFLEKGTISVESGDSLSKARLSGTRANEDYMLYKEAAKPVSDAARALGVKYNSASDEKKNSKEFRDQVLQEQTVIEKQGKDINSRFIAGHPDSYLSLQTLIDGMNSESYPDATNLQPQFSKLSAKLRESTAGKEYQKRLDKLKSVDVGVVAPDFTQPDTDGKPVKLSDFRGKYLLVDFWASWCGPCRNENPNLVKAYGNFKAKNFTILSVSLDQPGKKADWIKAIQSDGLIWNHVSDLKFWNNDAALLYNVRAIPQNVLIDPTGKIVARNLFGTDLQTKLAEVLR